MIGTNFIGLDIGTSGVKALLLDQDQQVIGDATAPLTVHRGQAGYASQDPADWLAACDACMKELGDRFADEMAYVAGIGLSGQMHGATVLDAQGSVLRRAILWNDTRSHAEAAEMDADPAFRAISGNVVFPGFTAPKLAWMKVNESEAFKAIDKVLLPKDYVRFWLAGELVSEMSDASGTSWLDTGARDWSDDLLERTGLTRNHMPALVEGTEHSGLVKPDLSARWGLPDRVFVAGGAGDNAAAACGMGVVQDGQAFASLGTSGVLFAANSSYRPDPATAVHSFCHALLGLWHQMGVILSASDALTWFSGITGRSPADLTDALGTTLHAPSQVQFLPYLSGERTPHNDAMARGSFTGLSHASDTNAMTQAVLQGVGFALRDCDAALAATGTDVASCLATGGGANSLYWLKMLATILNKPIDLPEGADLGAAFGAARLSMVAAGAEITPVMTRPKIAAQIEPNRDLVDAYDASYATFKSLYPAIRTCQ